MSALQETLTQFVQAHAEVDLEVKCGLSRELLEDLNAGHLDLAVSLIFEGAMQCLVRAWEERPIWTAAQGAVPGAGRPVPIVCHPQGCEYRARMIRALRDAGRDWRIAYTSPDIRGLQDAVLSGLGVSALTRATFCEGMEVLTEAHGWPKLEKIRVGLFYKHPELSEAGLSLANHFIARLDRETDAHFTQSVHPPQRNG